MRRPDTSKQRLWLGSSEYFDSCGDAAAANSDSHAESFTFGDSMWGYSDSNANRDSYGNSNFDAHTECNSDRHSECNSDAYTKCNTNSDSECNPHTHGDSYPQSDTKGSADTASSTDAALSPLANAFGVKKSYKN
jgi:hypothetical protein